MRVACCFSGQMRTLDKCLASIRKHLLEPLEADVFVHAAADEDADKALALEPKILHVEAQPWFEEKSYARQLGRGCAGIQSVLRQHWSIKKSNDLKRKHEAARGFRYDVTVRVRPDTEFLQGPLELTSITPDLRGVWIPKFSNWYGLNDRFAFGTNEEMDLYSMRADVFDDYLTKGGVFHPESFLFWHLVTRRIQVRRTNVAFYTLRPNGERILPDFYSEYREHVPLQPRAQADCLDVKGLPDMPCLGDGKPFEPWGLGARSVSAAKSTPPARTTAPPAEAGTA